MRSHTILKAMPIVCAGILCAACGEDATAPDGGPDFTRTASTTGLLVASPLPEAFTARAPVEPYFINQNPDLMLRSQVTADMAIQRLVTAPGGGGGWHTHPGPSFAIVDVGAVMITRYDRKTGCTSTTYGPNEPAGKTYYEVADEVHKATVVSPVHAVEYKVRFNVPAGAPFGDPVPEPVC
ncbi:MAG TPA: hypothetical protein VK912_07760 [Longimicrobiales bacterium]|nr:hypothetical protein [Longimicrobiales bacterium]